MANPQLYNPNIPNANDQIAVSQSQLLNNNQAIQALVDVNHYDFTSAVNGGKHWVVGLPVQSASPPTNPNAGSPAYVADTGEIRLYNKVYTYPDASVNNELFIHKQATGVAIPSTAASFNTKGFSYLPSGVIFNWGTATFAANTFVNQSFALTFPNNLFSVLATPAIANLTTQPFITLPTTSSMRINFGSAVTGNVFWFAVGN